MATLLLCDSASPARVCEWWSTTAAHMAREENSAKTCFENVGVSGMNAVDMKLDVCDVA